jgi:gamma-butyrobetaine dioxygenase
MQEIFERGAILVKDGPIVLIHNDDHNTVKDAERHYRQQQEQESVVGDLGKRFSGGALSHGSLYGDIFHVQTKDNAENIAYTNVPLPPHQDLTYYESKPFLQLLHCVNNTEGEGIGHAQQSKATIESRIEGGESILIDAMAAAEELKLLAPDLFDVLCRREAIFLKEREGAGMISPKPHIVCDPTYGQVVEINWSPPFEGPLQLDPNIPVDLYVRAYQAMECISTSPDPNTKGSATRIGMLLPTDLRKKLRDYAVQYTWQYELQRGDILVFNNQRMLHGRRGFVSVGNGQRHLIGCYTESDATLSRYRQLLRDSSHHSSFDNGPDSVSSHAKLGYGRRNAGNGCRWM